jgi:molybdate transport system regulatory protein
MSYKGAWDAVDTMNNLAGEPLVVRLTGGKGGGGTTLTPRAVKLIETFHAVEREHRRFLERAGAAIEGFATDWDLIGRIGVKTSARNQFYGTVSAITRGTVNDEVSLALPGGHTIVAVLTHESTEALGLVEGVAAFALIKASWVVLLVEDESGAPLKLSARNQLRGAVQSVKRGAVNAEVSLMLAGGAVVTAVVTNDSVDALGLAEGSNAVAAFKASSVILGVKD